jgi:hypothetical protein
VLGAYAVGGTVVSLATVLWTGRKSRRPNPEPGPTPAPASAS